MEPAFYRGDLLFLTNPASEQYRTGDITVYKIPRQEIPIVHRVLETHDLVQKKKEYVYLFMCPVMETNYLCHLAREQACQLNNYY